ncbi:HutD family protein [Dokdonella sp.]|uniref:HutD/Ves family protein n=1 Tax=Dokdonella sp. TaxID=2291710 RepID=UPI002C5C6D85|nr:HutD family protein [Dokdonella sp.]HPN80269.1 HutD family protein [Dokdonella sp.]
MRLLRARDYRRTRWKNDGGWTTEIASAQIPGSDTGFRWRVSIADIETDGPFSSFPAIERDLLLLAGNGIELDINEAAPLRLDQRFQRVHFAGEDQVHCRLLAGPTRDFNVMAHRDSVTAEVLARPLNGTMLVFVEPASTWLIYVFAGQARARGDHRVETAETGETLLIESSSDARERIVIEGGGELVLVKFSAAGDPVESITAD